ncbi:MAG: radical SAM protein [Bacteroidia bacterium]|nr:radical SAM protein [Bacteroidia bacterium]
MLSRFHTLYLEATRNCNFSCENCSAGSGKNKWKTADELSFDEIANRILVPGFKLGTRYIEFSGGEFLLREDAFDLLAKADEIGYRIGIASNGTTLNDKTIRKLKSVLGDNILISLGINSFIDAENKKSRSLETDKVLKLIEKLEKEYIRMNICITMGRHTADDFEETLKQVRKLQLPYNRIPFVPRNSMAAHRMFDKEILKTKFHPFLRKYFHGYVSYVPFFLPEEIYRKWSGQSQHESLVPTNPSVGCWCGSFYSVNPEGEVAPCPLLGDHLSGGNVKNTNLEDILFHSELFRKIISRKHFGGKCGTCKFNFTCGGCRAMAFYHTGDVFGEDPTCFINDISDSELKEMEKEVSGIFRNYVRLAKFGGLYSDDFME